MEKAQQKVEARNFDIRKQLLKYDDVMNDQRKVIYEQRREIMNAEDVNATVTDMRHEVIESLVNKTIPAGTYHEQWDLDTLAAEVAGTLNLDEDIKQWADEEGVADQEILERLLRRQIEDWQKRLLTMVPNYFGWQRKVFCYK